MDPRNQVLYFLNHEIQIPLQSCRKNLLSVDLVELLKVEQGEGQKEEVYHQSSMNVLKTSNDMQLETSGKESKSQENSGFSDHTQSYSPPFCMTKLNTTIVQKPCLDSQHAQGHIHAATSRDRVCLQEPTLTTCAEVSSNEHAKLPPCRIVRRGGPRTDHAEDSHGCTGREVQDSTRDQDSPSMGRTEVPVGEAPGKDLFPGVSGGRRVLDAGEESQSGIDMDEEFSKLHPCNVAAEKPSAEDVEAGEHQPHHGVPGEESVQGCAQFESIQPEPRQGQRVGKGIIAETAVSGEGAEQASVHHHAHRGKPREGGKITDSDRNSPTRTGHRDTGAGGPVAQKVIARKEQKVTLPPSTTVLDEGQVLVLHENVSQKILEIQGGLSKLKEKHPVLGFPKTTKGSDSRPIDLLEVYCGDESQITQQINQQGGRALRFTKKDGDLATKEGVNKLWTWVEMYEPEHIWVAPECRLWGSFAQFNMGRSETMCKSITNQRQHEVCHLELCNDLYNHQVACGRHFHLEQPMGSEMTQQSQLNDAMTGTLPAVFDMCRAGKLLFSPKKNRS